MPHYPLVQKSEKCASRILGE